MKNEDKYLAQLEDKLPGYKQVFLSVALTDCIHHDPEINVVHAFNVMGTDKDSPIGEEGEVYEAYIRRLPPIE